MDSKRNKFFNVKNRSGGKVSYSIPEDNIYRVFEVGETKRNISYGELEKLSFQSGGKMLMANYLQIDDAALAEEFNLEAEKEYWYTEEQIIDIMENGSMDAFLDMLDFAPIGVIDLVKSFAVSMKLNDFRKREAIYEKTGFNVTKALENISDEIEPSQENTAAPQRRVKEEDSSESEYKIIKEED